MDNEREDGWTEEAKREYELYLASKDEDDCALPRHKRKGYAEQMAEVADDMNDRQREEMLK